MLHQTWAEKSQVYILLYSVNVLQEDPPGSPINGENELNQLCLKGGAFVLTLDHASVKQE